MEKITNFLKTYWWIWLILLVVSTLILIFGTSIMLQFLYKIWYGAGIIFWVVVVTYYFFGRRQTRSWGVFRLLGILGVLFFGLESIYLKGDKNLSNLLGNSFFSFGLLGLSLSLFLFVLGEIFLYLDNIQRSIKNIVEDNRLSKENTLNSMLCPRCYGKGFVDLNDIKRLGMEQEWGQGFCRYCDGEGNVEKGKTKILNPLRTDMDPDWHESDIL
jgi:hypothetical protein